MEHIKNFYLNITFLCIVIYYISTRFLVGSNKTFRVGTDGRAT